MILYQIELIKFFLELIKFMFSYPLHNTFLCLFIWCYFYVQSGVYIIYIHFSKRNFKNYFLFLN